VRTKVGYAGGTTANPSYRSLGDHTEVIELEYDPRLTTFRNILDFFWNHHDPHSAKACSRQYRSLIFYHNDEQRMVAMTSLRERERITGKKLPTLVIPAQEIVMAEDYHQKYLLQKQGWLLAELELEKTEDLVHSMVAARLNGYTNGYGSKENFIAEKDSLKLPNKVVDYVLKKIEDQRNKA